MLEEAKGGEPWRHDGGHDARNDDDARGYRGSPNWRATRREAKHCRGGSKCRAAGADPGLPAKTSGWRWRGIRQWQRRLPPLEQITRIHNARMSAAISTLDKNPKNIAVIKKLEEPVALHFPMETPWTRSLLPRQQRRSYTNPTARSDGIRVRFPRWRVGLIMQQHAELPCRGDKHIADQAQPG